jgi:hypothetical protein
VLYGIHILNKVFKDLSIQGFKVKILQIFIITLACFFSAPSPAFQNEPDGFGGITWGTEVSTLRGMVYDSMYSWAAGITSFYTRKGDILSMGKAKLASIRYGFFEGKFSDVLIEVRKRGNWLALKTACFEKYGRGFKENYYIEHYRWSGKITSMVLEYKEKEDLGILLMKSEMIYDQIRSKLRERVREEAQ